MSLSIKERIIRNLFAGYKKSQAKVHSLSYLFWECTLRCNLNCLHCGSDCRKESNISDMPIDDFVSVLKNIKTKFKSSEVMVVLTGGEPTLIKDLEECGRQIRNQGFPWGMVTNGFTLTEERFQNLLNAGLGAVTLSLDGLEENHNWIRENKKSYTRAVNSLKIISKAPNLVYDVVTCVNKRNINQLEEIRQLLLYHNVKAWRLFTIAPIGRAKLFEDLSLSGEEIKYLFEFIKSHRNDDIIKINFSCEAYTGEYENKIRDGLFYCRAGINIGSVLADGSVSACPNISRNFIQGNIYQREFTKIWENEFKSFRNRQWMKNGICKNCNEYKYCLGGAMHLRVEENSEILCCLNYKMKYNETN
ncbi:MAG TPA: TIGR04133 family radical SAM/SPASM protein [Bacteroidales bacterium]|nr:TIGR04133 family radical SAM/SPASM protein [Bacteroidales bacterium]HOL99082.1 TIGR04133 family radical SAM/SPASM protein [Bacteroidales bacterium]HOM37219.1 TIGR04133 family radical SAM/SPASM protein [Bacteroidales bacterium]HPD24986.1 TIGR04133 family radical SAM/SPASM protein [Bacteroidales bacterium]HRS99854.1 TIGR04133 family radical SAM/SPASM protein [Bacteroidales bacterium]